MISNAKGNHVSPGIYTDERDVTYSVKSLGITSLGLVGETLYGPAFQNIEVSNWGEFVDYFGGTSTEKFKGNGNLKYELPYIAKSYLEESKRLNVVKVLGLSGYQAGKAFVIKNGDNVAIVLRSKVEYNKINSDCNSKSELPYEFVDEVEIVEYKNTKYTSDCGGNTTSEGEPATMHGKFGLKITKKVNEEEKLSGYTDDIHTYYVSLNPHDSDYIYNILSNKPDGTTPIYIEALYESSVKSLDGNDYVYFTPTSGKVSANASICDYKESYKAAATPWIVSDAIVTEKDGNKEAYLRKLFRFITISDGDAANYQVKVSIQNIDIMNSTFDVVVRDFNDTDLNPVILENFRKCNLVEGDSNYIAYKIGSSDGGFVSNSKYILVEMSEGEDLSTSLPCGFMGYPMPKYEDGSVYKMLYNTEYQSDVKAKRQYFGISDIKGIDSDVFSYKGNLNSSNTVYTSGFHMDSLINESGITTYIDGKLTSDNFEVVSKNKVADEKYIPRLNKNKSYVDETIYADIKVRKFTVCFYGGFDGWDINRNQRTNSNEFKATKYNISESNIFTKWKGLNEFNLPLNLPSTAITSDYYAYLAGVRTFANPQDIDINILATPGINWGENSLLTQEIIDMVEDGDGGRGGDLIYVMASPNTTNVSEAIDYFVSSDIDSSYVCTYFPWVMYYDKSNKKYVELPATKDVVRNMAAIDNKSYPWFAPAGVERGAVNCIKANFKTTLADEDMLYEVGINPVKSFAQDGVKVWGNKTAYSVESPLNRINVRRLMIRVKKMINDASKRLIFEQYDETLEQQFKGIVEPILAGVKANRGIIDYRVITECTPETRDQHILPAKILIKPTQSLEYISISFVVYPESVSFEE